MSGRRFNGVIDRLVRYADGSMRVIDYKSGEMRSAGQEVLAQYRRQVSLYAAAVERLFLVKPFACVYFSHDGGVWEVAVSEEEVLEMVREY